MSWDTLESQRFNELADRVASLERQARILDEFVNDLEARLDHRLEALRNEIASVEHKCGNIEDDVHRLDREIDDVRRTADNAERIANDAASQSRY